MLALMFPRSRQDHPIATASRAWLDALSGPFREDARVRLRALLLRGAQFELDRRRRSLAHLTEAERDELATQAVEDAMTSILIGLETFPGTSRFTTWAYKFVLNEAAVKARRHVWRERPIALDASLRRRIVDADPAAAEVAAAMQTALTSQERTITTALALQGVPIDVLAERLETTRGALYAVLHGARRKLRTALAFDGPAHADRPSRSG
jgi:RNA polymerase sigma-70 factor (ECF subfamily)